MRPTRSHRRTWLLLVGFLGLVLVADLFWLRRWWRGRQEQRAAPYIRAAARLHGLDPALVKAVVWRESRFDPSARGGAGELGLMQVGEIAGQEWADEQGVAGYRHEHLLDPATNTLAGAWYLAKVSRRYGVTDDPAAYGLADYNAGRANVLRWQRGPAATNSAAFLVQMDFPGTREYVRATLKKREEYRAAGRQ